MTNVEALVGVVNISRACAALAVPHSSFYRHLAGAQPALLTRPRPTHPRALRVEEQTAVVTRLNNAERFIDCAPPIVYTTLLDEGIYLCHWRMMYQLLAFLAGHF